MFKRAIEIIKLAAAVILISTITIWTTGIIVTHYLDSLLKQYNIPFDMKPVVVSGFWGTLWGANPPVKSNSTQEPGDAVEVFGQLPDSLETDSESDNTNTGTETETESETETDTEIDGNQTDPAGADDEGDLDPLINGNKGSSDIDGVDTAMTMEEITSVKDSISPADKEQLFAMLVGKLPEETWQQLSEIVEDGVTEQELSTIQQLMAMHLDKAEYEEMMNILKKY